MRDALNIRYLSTSEQDLRWGLTVNTVGHQRIKSHASYPSSNHPSVYVFSPDKGRILTNEYQLIYIIEGQGHFVSANKKRVDIKSGQMVLLFPGEWHSYEPDENTGWYEHWVGFSGSYMDRLVSEGFFTKEAPLFNVGRNEEIIKLYRQAVFISQQQSAGFQQILAGLTQLLLGYAYSGNKEASFENIKVIEQINSAKKMIIENYNKAIPPEDIAMSINMSYSWFRKLFKKYTGFSPSQFRDELRFQKSKELLVETNMNSQEIAFEVGFNTPYHFCILFKKRTGYTPLLFRKMARNTIQKS